MPSDNGQVGPLGDSTRRSYAATLDSFQRFAAPELRRVVAGLNLRAGDAVLDAGCGTGALTALLAERVAPGGRAVGVDISAGHLARAREHARVDGPPFALVQADLAALPVAPGQFDLVWCSNAVNHLRAPLDAVRAFAGLLAPGGRLALGQSAFLPDMFFAWDARLEAEVTRACYRSYREQYGLDERDTTDVRNLLGLLQRGGLRGVRAETVLIERTAPLAAEDEEYFLDGVFRAHWGERLRPYLSPDDWLALARLCDPDSPDYCLRRPDFHHLQTYTVVVGST
jgi:SAM-dependent methyltransferase